MSVRILKNFFFRNMNISFQEIIVCNTVLLLSLIYYIN